MVDILSGFFAAAIGWLSQWIPRPAATLVTFAVVCFAVGVPLSEAWVYLRRRWWRYVGTTERRCIIGALSVGTVIWARGAHTNSATLMNWGLLCLLTGVAAIAFTLRPKARPSSAALWLPLSETAPGFPVVVWEQEVDLGIIEKDERNRIELNLMLAVLMGGPVIGWVLYGWTGAIVGFFVASFFAMGADRDATPPKLENVGGYVPMPGSWGRRQPTEHERRIDAEPVTEFWQAQAYIAPVGGSDLIEGEPYFVVNWRNTRTGDVATICSQAWKDLAPFELGSYEALFGYRAAPLQYKDPWVITVRSEAAGMILLARDMRGQRRLQDLFLFKLSPAFGVERRSAFFRVREAERRSRGLDQPPVMPAPPMTQGVKQRPKL